MGNDTPIMETEYTGVFKDRYPCVKGHTLFIPKKNSRILASHTDGLPVWKDKSKGRQDDGIQCWHEHRDVCRTDHHVATHTFHPRHEGDSRDIGGMRHAHPGADHKQYY